ncbi:hypothetical protein ATE84_4367 [Aquimarina sp. MAR_2010_214]|uniref:hypothetical protein n=1 Tax=Aquimarina sp. MAR_2010_214 TaxID=1250026 RepID=UPI000C6FE35D|nr:hypothetical protein [Aquimarina sp. MAR_2010_214]PKV52258.1 hypothetical protein ATE84_4367 [Aquimarina sp. MAR_2010_214]
MKKLNVLLIVVAFAISSVASANTNPTKTENALNKEIKALLKKPSFKIKKELTAYVTFALNSKGEIVVLSVDSESEKLEGYIKSRLNYKKIGRQYGSEPRVFKMPLRIVEE